jgi:hypothetical protein
MSVREASSPACGHRAHHGGRPDIAEAPSLVRIINVAAGEDREDVLEV